MKTFDLFILTAKTSFNDHDVTVYTDKEKFKNDLDRESFGWDLNIYYRSWDAEMVRVTAETEGKAKSMAYKYAKDSSEDDGIESVGKDSFGCFWYEKTEDGKYIDGDVSPEDQEPCETEKEFFDTYKSSNFLTF